MFPGPQILLGNSGEPHGTFLSMIFLKLFQEKIQRKLGSQDSFLIRIVSHIATIYLNPYRSPTYLLQNKKIIIQNLRTKTATHNCILNKVTANCIQHAKLTLFRKNKTEYDSHRLNYTNFSLKTLKNYYSLQLIPPLLAPPPGFAELKYRRRCSFLYIYNS